MTPEELQELLGIFREETREIRDRVAASLTAIPGSTAPMRAELYETLVRDAHTLKGGAASVELADLALLAQVAERLLRKCQSGARTMDLTLSGAIVGALDAF